MDHDVTDRQSLVARWAAACKPPEAPFDPLGAWTHRYEQRSTFSLGVDGGLLLVRKPVEPDAFTLESTLSRRAIDGYHYLVQTTMKGRVDTFGATEGWTVQTKVATAADAASALRSGLEKRAIVSDGNLRLRVGEDSSTMPLKGPVFHDVALLEAVQRLPAEESKPLWFTLVEEGDLPSNVHRLSFRQTYDVQTAGGVRRLSCFQHLGPGVVPATYWLDAHGRLLLMLTGMVMYVLAEEDGQPIPLEPLRR